MEIDGPAGVIEAQWDVRPDASRAGLICHPHPLYGGNMHDNVVSAVAEGMRQSGLGTLQFNFRGVGGSSGQHDQGKGEQQDVLTLLRWLTAVQGASRLMLSGYSFGALVALNACHHPDIEEGSVASLLLIAPPMTMSSDLPEPGQRQVTVICGSEDQIAPVDAVRDWAGDDPHIEIVILQGANHFFLGHYEEITRCTADKAE